MPNPAVRPSLNDDCLQYQQSAILTAATASQKVPSETPEAETVVDETMLGMADTAEEVGSVGGDHHAADPQDESVFEMAD